MNDDKIDVRPDELDFPAYARKIITRGLATYPLAGRQDPMGVSYCLLGLIGEAFEVPLPATDRDKMVDELGDVAWYLAMVWHEMGEAWRADVTTYARPSGLRADAYHAQVDILRARCADLCQAYKRVLRDDAQAFTCRDAWLEAVKSWVRCCIYTGVWPHDVLDHNIEKLVGRQSRGTLHGKGDRR